MSGAIPSLPQYAFMVLCIVKAQGRLYLLPLTTDYTGLDYERNLDVMKELNTQPVVEFIDN
jgi:hypothetical protein